jgi:NTP pyrophosphatase (non-canonical NTP hydrolase)
MITFEQHKRINDSACNLQHYCHALAKKSGWWDDLLPPQRGTVAEKLLLVHSEISEACEGYRKDLMDDHLPHRKMVEVELADALIRICDLAGAMDLDLGGAVAEKLLYNQQRADHKPENRALEGGKKF